MNYKMPGTKIVQTLPAFLKLHRIKKDDNTSQKPSTHTRISGKDEDGEYDSDDLPAHHVNIHNDFLMGTVPVIQEHPAQ